MRKYAFLLNNKVVKVDSIDEQQYSVEAAHYQLIVDIEDIVPQPEIDWTLEGNILVPFAPVDQLQFEEDLARRKCKVGREIAEDAIVKLGALNKILGKSGAQVSQVLQSMSPVRALLETGALGTARSAMLQLSAVYPEYDAILSEAVSKINEFQAKYGL